MTRIDEAPPQQESRRVNISVGGELFIGLLALGLSVVPSGQNTAEAEGSFSSADTTTTSIAADTPIDTDEDEIDLPEEIVDSESSPVPVSTQVVETTPDTVVVEESTPTTQVVEAPVQVSVIDATTSTTTSLPPETTDIVEPAPRVLASPEDPVYGEIACTDSYAELRKNMTLYGTEDFLNENCSLSMPEGYLSQINAKFFGGIVNLDNLSLGQKFALDETYTPEEILPITQVPPQQTSSPSAGPSTQQQSAVLDEERCENSLGGTWDINPGMFSYFENEGYGEHKGHLTRVMGKVYGFDGVYACLPGDAAIQSNLPS